MKSCNKKVDWKDFRNFVILKKWRKGDVIYVILFETEDGGESFFIHPRSILLTRSNHIEVRTYTRNRHIVYPMLLGKDIIVLV